jgi:ubiquitin
MKQFDLLQTKKTPNKHHKTELTIGINGQEALQVRQLFAMERMYKNWNDWRVKLGVWLIRRTEL